MTRASARRRIREIRGSVFAALLRGARTMAGLASLPSVLSLGRAGGRLAWILLRRDRRRALEHLEIAFGSGHPEENARIARAAFENAGRTLAEIVVLDRLSLATYVSIDGLENLDRGLAAGRGVIAVAAHRGNWELLAASVADRGYRVAVVGRRPHERALFELLEEVRRGYGVETIWRESEGSARQILRALREGWIVALLIDQETSRVPSVTVPFFGRPARTPSGAATLSLRFGAPIVPVFIERTDRGHRIEFEPAIELGDGAGEGDPAVVALTARATEAIERRVRERPEEWVWWHRRWRRVS